MNTSPGSRALPSAVDEVLGWLARPLAMIFVLCVPLALVCNNVRWVTLSPETYRRGFSTYGAGARTGLDSAQLEAVARAFIEYFQASPGRLNPQVVIQGRARPLFNQREEVHMADVQQLMQLVFRAGLVAEMLLAVLVASAVVRRGTAALPGVGRLMLWGSGLSVVVLAIVGGLSLLDFTELFVRFHQMSFSNDLWMLDPRTDYLLMLFPEGFWFDVTIQIGLMTLAEAALVAALGWWLTRR